MTGYSEISPERKRPQDIPGRVWAVLLSWGLAGLGMTALFAYGLWNVQREGDEAIKEVQRDRDQAMCELTEVFVQGPEPVAGPAGDRARDVRARLVHYREQIGC